MDLVNVIKRPFSDIKKFLIGVILSVLPIVNFLPVGYSLECAKLSMQKDKSLPEWTNWGRLFLRGLSVLLIGIIWMIPAIILGIIAFVMFGQDILSLSTGYAATSGLWIILSAVLFVAMITIYVMPSAVLGYVAYDNIKESFNFSEVLRKAFTKRYFKAWIIATIITFVLSIIGGAIPLLNVVLSPAASFAGTIITMTLLGEVYPEL